MIDTEENEIKNWRIQLDVKTTRSKLREVEKIIKVIPWTPITGKKYSRGELMAACPKLNHEKPVNIFDLIISKKVKSIDIIIKE